MLTVASMLVAGGFLFSGTVAYQKIQPVKRWLRRPSPQKSVKVQTVLALEGAANEPDNAPLQSANRTLMLSSASLGLVTAGVLFKPALMLVSVPVGLAFFAPSFQAAWHSLRQEHRITTPVLDATRVTLCVVMGYHFTLALDTWLRALAHKLFVSTEQDLAQTLDKYFADSPNTIWIHTGGSDVQVPVAELDVDDIINVSDGDLIPVSGTVRHGAAWVEERIVTGQTASVRKVVGDAIFADTTVVMGEMYVQIDTIPEQLATSTILERLTQTIEAGSHIEQLGKKSGDKMAPCMLAAFAIMLPFWEVNRAAGLLTTSFGSQMTELGPCTLRNVVNLAVQQNLLILDGRALEYLNLVNTIVVDACILEDPELRSQAKDAFDMLRKRRWPIQELTKQRFSIFLMAEGDEESIKQLAAEVGADDYFVEPLAIARATLLERLQTSGRIICYIGDGQADALVVKHALVSVAIPSATGYQAISVNDHAIQIVLVEKKLERLGKLFDIAAQFAAKQSFNIAWPLVMDIVDIGTTVFVHFGLVYSVLFNYAGLLTSTINARVPLLRHRRAQKVARAEENRRFLPNP